MIFAALHLCREVLATNEMSVCLSVRPSVCETRKLWQKKRNLYQHSYTTWKTFILVFWLVGNDPFYLKFWVKLTSLERKRQFSSDIRS